MYQPSEGLQILTPLSLPPRSVWFVFFFFKGEFFFFFGNFIHLLLAVLGLRCCMGFSLVVMLGLLIAVPYYCRAQLQGVQASSAVALRFWSTDRLCGHGARA